MQRIAYTSLNNIQLAIMQPNTNILLHAVPGFILLLVVELVFLIKEHQHDQFAKDVKISIWIGIGFLLSGLISKGLLVLVYSIIYEHRVFMLTGAWWVWLLAFFADDFSYYWFHRLSHEVRFFWASHMVHHSSEIYTFSTAIRNGWTANISGAFLFWAWMPFVGFEPGAIMFIKSISMIYQFWLHTELIKKMPAWFEAFFNTPSHHRVHHGTNLEYLDTNFAGTLIIWDKLFGTYRNECTSPKYGLTKKIDSTNPLDIVFSEWNALRKDLQKAKKMKDRIYFIFKAPGWSNDGKSQTTRALRSSVKNMEIPLNFGEQYNSNNAQTFTI